MRTWAAVAVQLGLLVRVAVAGVVTTQGQTQADLAASISSEDVIQGLIPSVLPGDNGWHPVNQDPADQLPAFTDGLEIRTTGLTGLLNDFPGEGKPTKLIDYQLASVTNIGEIRVFTGNNNRDGRVFHTYTVEFSTDGGQTYSSPIYVQSHASGTLNNASQPSPPFNNWRIVLTQLTADNGRALALKATNIRFSFYAVDNTGGQMRDPFGIQGGGGGITPNPFTGADDTLSFAFVSPLVWEIDVLPFTGEVCDNGIDDDNNGFTDCADLAACTGDAACRCSHDPVFDVDDDADVDQADFGVLQACFTGAGDPGRLFDSLSLDCQCMDLTGTNGLPDQAIGPADLLVFMRCYTGPAMSTLLDPGCDQAPF